MNYDARHVCCITCYFYEFMIIKLSNFLLILLRETIEKCTEMYKVQIIINSLWSKKIQSYRRTYKIIVRYESALRCASCTVTSDDGQLLRRIYLFLCLLLNGLFLESLFVMCYLYEGYQILSKRQSCRLTGRNEKGRWHKAQNLSVIRRKILSIGEGNFFVGSCGTFRVDAGEKILREFIIHELIRCIWSNEINMLICVFR